MSSEDDELPFIGEGAGVAPSPRGFAPGEMVACEACLRANAPTRMNCLYCGVALVVADAGNDLRRPSLRALEAWEQGFNIVLLPQPTNSLSVDNLSEAARLLKLETGQLREMTQAEIPVPLARVASREEATLVESKLRALGFQVEIVADELLAVETQTPKRIRKLEINSDALTGWTNAEGAAERIEWAGIALLITGRITRKRIEVEERRGGRGGAQGGEVVETREYHTDESALDLYFAGSIFNWRIMAENFDYSCLGTDKSLTAAENFTHLCDILRERATGAAYDDSYRGARSFLKFAWPLAEQTGAGNLRRIRPGHYNSEAVTSVTNEMQFTRYGRLLQIFRLRSLLKPT